MFESILGLKLNLVNCSLVGITHQSESLSSWFLWLFIGCKVQFLLMTYLGVLGGNQGSYPFDLFVKCVA